MNLLTTQFRAEGSLEHSYNGLDQDISFQHILQSMFIICQVLKTGILQGKKSVHCFVSKQLRID